MFVIHKKHIIFVSLLLAVLLCGCVLLTALSTSAVSTNGMTVVLDAGHGGMDYVMLKHFFMHVKDHTPMPIDIYDAVAWMSVTALSEQSIAKGSAAVECPDFTRGKYKERKVVDVMELPSIK